jgi:hypothetical protein
MPRPVREVSDIYVDEISLVDIPANQHAAVVIAKRATEEDTVGATEIYDETGAEVDPSTLTLGDVVYDETGQAFEVVPENPEDIPEGFDAMNEDQNEELLEEVGKAGIPGMNAFAAGLSKPGVAAKGANSAFKAGQGIGKAGQMVGRNKVAFGAAGAGALAGGTAVGVSKSFADEIREELSKAATEVQRDEILAKALTGIAQAEARAEQAELIAKSEQDLRLEREYIEVAKGYNVPINPDELGPVLKRMTENMSYEDCSVIAKALEASGGMIFDEVGFIGGGDNVDVFSQVEAAIDGQIAKANGSVSKAHAVTEFFDGNQDAYEAYLAGN